MLSTRANNFICVGRVMEGKRKKIEDQRLSEEEKHILNGPDGIKCQ